MTALHGPLGPANFVQMFRYPTWLYVLLCVLGVGVGAVLRLVDLPAWSSPDLVIDGEHLLMKPDGYGFLAGAKRLNHYGNHPLTMLIRSVHRLTDWKLGNIGFWLPVFLAPLVALPLCAVAFKWRVPEAAIAAGAAAACCPGFLQQTRLGALDTDIGTLFLATSLGAGLVFWLEPMLRSSPEREPAARPVTGVAWTCCLGLLYRFYLWFYPSGSPIAACILLAAVVPGVLFCRNRYRHLVPAGAAVILAVGVGSRSVALAGLLVAVAAALVPHALHARRRWLRVGMALAGLVVLALLLPAQVQNILYHLGRYGPRTGGAGEGLRMPSVIATISEARRLAPRDVVRIVAGHWAVLVAGMVGLAYLAVRRPAALVFVPFLGLAAASWKLGFRFTLYGGVPVGLGLACGPAMLMRDLRAPRWSRWLVLSVLLVGLGRPLYAELRDSSPPMYIPKGYARVFQEVGRTTSPDAQIWTTWSYGYAAQYFAGRTTFADGSRNSPDYVLPLTAVHATRSPAHAHELVRFVAARQAETGPLPGHETVVPLYETPFRRLFATHSPQEIQALLEGNQPLPHPPTSAGSPQILVFLWNNLAIAQTISESGTWNVVSGEARPGGIICLLGDIRLDTAAGRMMWGPWVYDTVVIDIIANRTGTHHHAWPVRARGLFVVQNMFQGACLVMDEDMYNSLMVQMLIGDPAMFEPEFSLVVDEYPFGRAYRVNPVKEQP